MQYLYLMSIEDIRYKDNDYLEGNIVDCTELSQIFFMKVRMTLILENSRSVFLGAVEDLFNLSSEHGILEMTIV